MVIDFKGSVDEMIECGTDFECLDLTKEEYDNLYSHVEKELIEYQDVDDDNIESEIVSYLESVGFDTNSEGYWIRY